MAQLALIPVCLLVGIALRRVGWFGAEAHVNLNQFVLGISLPALSLLYIPQIDFTIASLAPIATAWIVFLLAWAIFGIGGSRLGFSKATIGCTILCCGLFNSSFIGFPVISALYGEAGMQQALLVDQPGSFLVLSTLGVWVAIWYSAGQLSPLVMARKLFTFPPMLAFLMALFIKLIGYQYPLEVSSILKSMGQTITPLALVSVGLQLRWAPLNGMGSALSAGLAYKLLLAPLAIYSLFIGLLGITGLPASVSVLEAGMAPMITGAILATQYRLNEKLANLFIGIGIPLSFVSLAFWYWLLG